MPLAEFTPDYGVLDDNQLLAELYGAQRSFVDLEERLLTGQTQLLAPWSPNAAVHRAVDLAVTHALPDTSAEQPFNAVEHLWQPTTAVAPTHRPPNEVPQSELVGVLATTDLIKHMLHPEEYGGTKDTYAKLIGAVDRSSFQKVKTPWLAFLIQTGLMVEQLSQESKSEELAKAIDVWKAELGIDLGYQHMVVMAKKIGQRSLARLGLIAPQLAVQSPWVLSGYSLYESPNENDVRLHTARMRIVPLVENAQKIGTHKPTIVLEAPINSMIKEAKVQILNETTTSEGLLMSIREAAAWFNQGSSTPDLEGADNLTAEFLDEHYFRLKMHFHESFGDVDTTEYLERDVRTCGVPYDIGSKEDVSLQSGAMLNALNQLSALPDYPLTCLAMSAQGDSVIYLAYDKYLVWTIPVGPVERGGLIDLQHEPEGGAHYFVSTRRLTDEHAAKLKQVIIDAATSKPSEPQSNTAA